MQGGGVGTLIHYYGAFSVQLSWLGSGKVISDFAILLHPLLVFWCA